MGKTREQIAEIIPMLCIGFAEYDQVFVGCLREVQAAIIRDCIRIMSLIEVEFRTMNLDTDLEKQRSLLSQYIVVKKVTIRRI